MLIKIVVAILELNIEDFTKRLIELLIFGLNFGYIAVKTHLNVYSIL